MPRVRGFYALEFDRGRTTDLSVCLSPPYDVLTREDGDRLLKNCAINAVALDLTSPGPDLNVAGHRRSAETLRAWIENGTLRESSSPKMLVLEDAYERDGVPVRRTGLICTVELEKLGGSILPHERVLERPIQDRLGLLRETRTHFSPIFFVCDDPARAIVDRVVRWQETHPFETFRGTSSGLIHRLWSIDDPEELAALSGLFAERQLLIADGHHRYQTAWMYSREPGAPVGAADMLAYVSFFPSEGLQIEAFHRIARTTISADDLIRRLERTFDIEELPLDVGAFARGSHPVGLVSPTSDRVHALRPRANPPWVDPDLSTIPSTILNGILREALGIDLADPAQQKNVEYFFDSNQFLSAIAPGHLGFWLQSASIADVFNVARAGKVLPQKSTYFYPKVPTGIAFHRVDRTED